MNQQAEAPDASKTPHRPINMRVLSGWLLFLFSVTTLLSGGIVFIFALIICGTLAGFEYIHIMRAKGLKPSPRITIFMINAFYLGAGLHELSSLVPGANAALRFGPESGYMHLPFLLTLGVCMTFFRLLFRHEHPPATIGDIATTILGFVYIGWMPAHFILLRNVVPPGAAPILNPLQQPGLAYVWAALFATFATDVFAYLIGRRFGKHLLYPEVSPKKTVEGALAGFVAAIFWTSLVVYASDNWLFPSRPFHGQWWQGPLLGGVVSIAAQLGDLCESMLKRDAGLKDSGSTIPGHGGMLDRGDGLIFAAPVAFYWILVFILGIL